MFDWKQRIRRARESGGFDKRSVSLANCWGSCAVGEIFGLTSNHFITGLDSESSSEVYDLGQEFADAINNDEFDHAVNLYDEIKKYKPQ